MPEITLYFAPRSRSLRALWLLEELGARFTLVPLDLERGDHKSAEMLRLNPMGKVPVVTVDGHPVWESPAIVAHLCDVFPEAGLAPPPGRPDRADFYRWLSFATAVMEPAFAEHMARREGNPLAHGWGDFASMKRALAAGLSAGEWLLPKGFSGADLLVGGNLAWFTSWAPEAFSDIPGLDSYVDRIRSRPAYRRASERDAAIYQDLKSGQPLPDPPISA
jgi:glutathione S-transferase